MHQNRISKSSNMLHYSNASSIEESRRYLVIKGGGLVWLPWQVGGVVDSVVELGSSSVGLVVCRKEEGGRNSKYNANISMTMRDMTVSGARGVLTRQQVVPAKGGTSGRYSRCFAFSDRRTGGGKLLVR